jgi:hypothetical protein
VRGDCVEGEVGGNPEDAAFEFVEASEDLKGGGGIEEGIDCWGTASVSKLSTIVSA